MPIPAPSPRVRDLPELLAVLPYLLGFHPQDEVVLVCVAHDRVDTVVRFDPPGQDWSGVPAVVCALLARVRPQFLVVVAYGTALDGPALSRCVTSLRRHVRVRGCLLVTDGTWVDLEQAGRGGAIPAPALVPAVAELVALGVCPVASLRDYERQVWRVSEEAHAVAAVLVAGPPPGVLGFPSARSGTGMRGPSESLSDETRRVALRVWADACEPGRPFDPAASSLAALLLALADVDFRDARLTWLVPLLGGPGGTKPDAGAGAGASTEQLLTLAHNLVLVAQRSPDRWRVLPLTMLGAVGWALGDGARARVALEAALRLAPAYPLAGLLARLVRAGVGPRTGSRRPAAGGAARDVTT